MTSWKKPLPPTALLRQLLIYDAESGDLFWRERPVEMFKDGSMWSAKACCARWNTRYAGRIAFTALNRGYRYGSIGKVNYMAHRVIWKIVHDEEPDEVDHRDGNRGNNPISNLRSVTPQQNATNRLLLRSNTSGFSGVCPTYNGRWRAYIGEKNEQKHVGIYTTLEEAVAARAAAERQFGYLSA